MAVNHHNSNCACPMSMAELELGAFMSAVMELYGPEHAAISAEDWLEELESMGRISGSTTREWRSITIAAAARLARRLADAGRHGVQRAEAAIA